MTPAERVAGAHCLIARHRGRETASHPTRCRFCSVDLPQLEAEVHDDDGSGMALFMQLPERRRRELVTDAAQIHVAAWMEGI